MPNLQPSNSTPRYILKNTVYMSTIMLIEAFFLHDSQKPETKMPVKRIAKQTVIYSISRIKHSNKNKNKNINYCNMQYG